MRTYQGETLHDRVSDSEVIVLLPSRSRPDELRKAHESVLQTSNASVFAFIDKDQRDLYEPLKDLDRLTLFVAPRNGPVHAVNTLCHVARPGGEFRHLFPKARAWAYMTDDSTIGPAKWDEWFLKAIDSLPNRIGVISAAHAGADYVNFPAMSTEMVEVLGWFALPNVHAWVWDTALEIIGDSTAIIYAKASEMDFVHRQLPGESLGIPKEDCWNFVLWCASERRRIIERVREAMK